MRDLDSLGGDSLKGALEALLLVSGDPVSSAELARILEVSAVEVSDILGELAAEYSDANRGFQLREVAGGWRLFTHPAYHEQVEAYVLSWDTYRLSQAALEALSVIAYHQPCSREEVKAVRGVNSDGVITSLREKGLVREVGRENGRTGAILYGTTKAFLERFGLRSLRDMPPLEDFAPDEESRQFIRERLSGRAISSTLEEAAADIDDERELLDEYGQHEEAEVMVPVAEQAAFDEDDDAEDDEMEAAEERSAAWEDDWEDAEDDDDDV